MAVKRHAGFKTQTIAGGKATRQQAVRRALRQQRIPESYHFVCRQIEFETVLTRVTGAAQEHLDAADLCPQR